MKPDMFHIGKYGMGLFYFAAGINHFINLPLYQSIMPGYLPYPVQLINISGVGESLLGLLLLMPMTTRFAAWGLIVLLIAVFPANIHMALHPALYPHIPAWLLWARLPLQIPLIAWAYCYTHRRIRSTPKTVSG